MPIYLYNNPKTNETVEVFQSMSEKHEYFDKEGLKWDRVFTMPQASFDSQIKDPFNSKEFAEKGSNKKATLGDWYDQSAELSEKRKEKYGKDPIKEQYFDKYKKDRNGKEHYLQKQERTEGELKKMDVILENFKSRAEYNSNKRKNKRDLKRLGMI